MKIKIKGTLKNITDNELIDYAGSTIDLVPTFLNLLGFDEKNADFLFTSKKKYDIILQ